jgi:3-dehydroquinate synthase II
VTTAKAIVLRTGNRALVARALEAGFTQFLLDRDLTGVGRLDAYRLRGNDVHRNGRRVGAYLRVADRADEHRVRALKGRLDLVIVEPTDWKVIPLENLVAALGARTRLFAVARDAKEARLFLGTLERGVDGVVLQPRTAKDLDAYRDLLEPPRPRVALTPARVTRIEPLGLGERVCVDTASLFGAREGLLVGSTSHGFFLVAAETAETEFVAARPFRVNAGAIHSYLWLGDRTTYLSEVRAGTRLEAVDAQGRRRPVVVGRAKIETRPLLLVEARAKNVRASVILQNAETIRLVLPRGRTRSVSELRVGDTVLVHPETGARHFGMKIQERIREV